MAFAEQSQEAEAVNVEPDRPPGRSIARPVARTRTTWVDKLITGYG
jgi:hypothetical protein